MRHCFEKRLRERVFALSVRRWGLAGWGWATTIARLPPMDPLRPRSGGRCMTSRRTPEADPAPAAGPSAAPGEGGVWGGPLPGGKPDLDVSAAAPRDRTLRTK